MPGYRRAAIKGVLYLTFDDLTQPVVLIDCCDLAEYFPLIFPGWLIKESSDCNQSPILTIKRQKSTYILDADWLKKPLSRNDRVDIICDLVVELMRAYIRFDTNMLCLHGAAAEFSGALVVFPNKYRAGKSILSACLAAADVKLFCDDVLPVSMAEGHGIAPGLAVRLRLPLPDNMDLDSRRFIENNRGLEGEQFLYLGLDDHTLAARGSHAPVGAFVLLEREEGAVPVLEAVSKAEVLHQVVWQNFAREAEAPRILQRLSQLVADTRRYRMRYDRAEDAVELLKIAFKDWSAPSREIKSISLTSAQGTDESKDVPVDAYLRRAGISVVTVDGEIFLADDQGDAIHHLNPVGSAIWTLLAEPATIVEMIEILQTAFPEVGPDQIEKDVSKLIERLASSNLVIRP